MADSRLLTSSFTPSSDDVDHLLDTVAAWTQHLFHRMADAFMSADGDAPLALHRALATMLREIADTPEMAQLATVELPSLGPLLHARREAALELFSTFLDVGLAGLPDPPADRDAIALCITGGLWETVRRYALEQRLHELPDALPGMSYFCLSTFFGADDALRVSTPPAHAG
jgi:AcrR family transcriptional regulator